MENFAAVKWNFPGVVITPSKQNWSTVEEAMPGESEPRVFSSDTMLFTAYKLHMPSFSCIA